MIVGRCAEIALTWLLDTSNGMLCRHISAPLPGSYLCVPILSEGQEIGLLYLQMDPGQQALTLRAPTTGCRSGRASRIGAFEFAAA